MRRIAVFGLRVACKMAMAYPTLLILLCLVGYNFSPVPTVNATNKISWSDSGSSSFSSGGHGRRDVPGDPQAMDDDHLKEMMKRQWLKILHLSKVPEDVPRTVPEYMQSLSSMIETYASASVKQDPSVSGEHAAWAIKAFDAHRDNDNFSIYFNVFLEFDSSMISRVELVFEGTSNQSKTSQNLSTAVEVCGVNGTACHRPDIVRHLQFDGAKSTYDVYDLTRPFVLWWASVASSGSCIANIKVVRPPFIESFTGVSTNDLLLIIYQNMTPDIKLDRKVRPGQGSLSAAHQAYDHHSTLESTVAHNQSKRYRRDTRRNASAFCQLQEWYVDFHSLGWDWVIVPTRFGAGFCDGSCQTFPNDLEQVNLTNHAFLRTAYRAILGPSLGKNGIPVPTSTCVPIRYRPLSILYKANNETFILRTISDMIATSCGCL